MGNQIVHLTSKTLESYLEENGLSLVNIKIENKTLSAKLLPVKNKKLAERVHVFLSEGEIRGVTDRTNLLRLIRFFSEGKWGTVTSEQLLNMKCEDFRKQAHGLGPRLIESLKNFYIDSSYQFKRTNLKEFPFFQK